MPIFFQQIYLICDCEYMWGHCSKALAVIRLYCRARVEILDILVRVNSDQDVCHVGVDLIFSVSEIKLNENG